MADGLAEFVVKTEKMATGLRTLEHSTVEVAALAVKTSVLAQMAAAGVKDGKLRGVGKKGTRIGVRYDFTGQAVALVRATGPFHLLERDNKPHREPKVRGSRARRRVLVIPGVGVRAWANHPGSKGKHPWEKGVVAAMPIQEKAQGLALLQTLEKAYR